MVETIPFPVLMTSFPQMKVTFFYFPFSNPEKSPALTAHLSTGDCLWPLESGTHDAV